MIDSIKKVDSAKLQQRRSKTKISGGSLMRTMATKAVGPACSKRAHKVRFLSKEKTHFEAARRASWMPGCVIRPCSQGIRRGAKPGKPVSHTANLAIAWLFNTQEGSCSLAVLHRVGCVSASWLKSCFSTVCTTFVKGWHLYSHQIFQPSFL